MNIKAVGIILSVSLCSSAPIMAADLSLGLMGGTNSSPYKGVDSKGFVMPLISADSQYLYLHTTQGGIHLYRPNQQFQINLFAEYSGTEFKPHDSDNHQMRLLDHRKPSVYSGLGITFNTGAGRMQASVMYDVFSHSNGWISKIGYAYPIQQGALTLIPSLSVQYNSKHQNQYYYGISSGEATRSGLSSYQADGGLFPTIGLTARYHITQNWIAQLNGQYTFYNNDITDSPMVDSDYALSASAGIMYHF
ncbi:MipA/OmpV family protein [Celerinatantimonas sp. YJH-8]|uniref:MipA/OmpV family protein n=1 Tax=Celerinatantimonas sp. YJH-8 TaxID=3228714 RepID=UPI0038BEE06E